MTNFFKFLFGVFFSVLTFALGVDMLYGLFPAIPQVDLSKLYMAYLVVCNLFIPTSEFIKSEELDVSTARALSASVSRFFSIGIVYILYLIIF